MVGECRIQHSHSRVCEIAVYMKSGDREKVCTRRSPSYSQSLSPNTSFILHIEEKGEITFGFILPVPQRSTNIVNNPFAPLYHLPIGQTPKSKVRSSCCAIDEVRMWYSTYSGYELSYFVLNAVAREVWTGIYLSPATLSLNLGR